ncbi:hypothetical protein KVR01_007631 [Diaporthe batatas]|uniref:uncharacterized protein n=1 Tax=Diaporthe batatas TaxID=748121 RepID=UPI001D0456DB|nr:uncharacterized protein KVR01_007631 [Diaporthe batatas]KAG8163153.1 hypothetical protein KVR01_007631 [Diaporthe batatas]
MADSQYANTSDVKVKPRVFRVRNLPAHVDRLSAVELLCQSIDGVTAQDIRLSSLAYDSWSRFGTKTATATITIHVEVPGLDSRLVCGECTISVTGLSKPLIIDHHFQGITPLNHVPEGEHKFDCLVISGLASHPFGSWQTHGHDKSFMWIRDELLQRLPGVRFLVYGYDTTLGDSKSFQLIPDLAVSLVDTVKSIGWSTPSAKPVLFLAHSLGGVVLKQVLVILAGGGSDEWSILTKTKGAIFFGVPSQGMSIPDIFEMLGDQPNKALVKDLSDQSNFLPRLDEQFGNISYLRRLQFFWAYETKVTPIVEKDFATGRFSRTGPGTVMVSRESATRHLCRSQPSLTVQIDENHSDMVKFGIGSKYIGIIASKLGTICAMPEHTTAQFPSEPSRKLDENALAGPTATSKRMQNPPGKLQSERKPISQPESKIPGFWSHNDIVMSFKAPERDRRLEQINQKVGDTFNWAYDDSSTGLSQWLRAGTGIFWIHGKPGSGKSTLMKYLFQDPRTEELLRAGSWQSRAHLTTASFFFHHRGTDIQKSFEGLLRSLLSQILEQHESLSPLLHSILEDQYRSLIASEGLASFEEDVWDLLGRFGVSISSEVIQMVEEVVVVQVRMTENRRLGAHLMSRFRDIGVNMDSTFEGQPLEDYEIMSRAATSPGQYQRQVAKSQSSDPESWEAALGNTLKRHYRRQTLKAEMLCSRASLEECFRRLIGQSLFKMDLFLFLDALDEYGGRPEFIASFLQDIVQQTAEPGKPSLTSVRIIFSSRPWKVIHDEFAACPGFQIHDYTGNDIFEFCVANIPPEHTAKSLLAPFATEIVRRARGVFLWVELVMRDLTKIVLRGHQLQGPEELGLELRKTLDSIPDELDDYYHLILQRIPLGNRWDSYVVLETICRSAQEVETGTMLEILKCSSAKSFADAKHKLSQISHMASDGSRLKRGKLSIETVSGGLVEIGGHSSRGEPTWQFMHQTVKQFVEGPQLKLRLLGNTIGAFSTENGHYFIAKHRFVHGDFDERFFRHARKAEVTTGYSQYDFFSTAPSDHYSTAMVGMGEAGQEIPGFQQKALVRSLKSGGAAAYYQGSPVERDLYHPSSMIELAVLAGLQLCIRDSCEANPSCIRDSSVNLLEIWNEAAIASKRRADIERNINIAELLVAKGLSISLEADLLRQARPKLILALLARGFLPTNLDTDGETPLDFVLRSEDPRLDLEEKYDIVSQLVCKGGLLRSTPRWLWADFETMCASEHLDTTLFRQAGFPLWYSDTEPASENKYLRSHLSRSDTEPASKNKYLRSHLSRFLPSWKKKTTHA